jgi:glycosyltransferase involved in cell wall biosynthesis
MTIRNILICTTQVPFTTGGAESHVASLRQALVEAGYQAEIVALPFNWYPPLEIMRSTLAWRLLNLNESNGRKVDLIVGMKFPAYTVAHPSKVLWIMHQHRAAYNLWGTAFDDLSTYPDGVSVRDFIRHADETFIPEAKKVFANSKTVADRLRKYNKIESEPLYHPPPNAERLYCGEIGDYIFYPSRLEPQKRQELLIEAMHFVESDVKAIFAGGTNNLNHYQSLIKQYDVRDCVSLADRVAVDELSNLYANALAVCYLPFDEDYGYVTLEAMISGRPVIVARDSGGAVEFVEDGVTGFVVDPDPRALAAALDQLYGNRDRARKMGAAGREKLLAMNISWENVVARIISAAEY